MGAAAGGVDWQQPVSALWGGGEWRQLLADLTAEAGGSGVAALLQSAAAALAAGEVLAGGSSGGSNARLAEVVQQVAWEKLHTGDWHAVPVAWRDTYAAACILAAAAGLPGGGGGSSGKDEETADGTREEAVGPAAAPLEPHVEAAAEAAGSATAGDAAAEASSSAAEAAALSAALWHLDMAAIMGGPLLRPAVDALIDMLQCRWQHLHSTAAAAASGVAAPAGAGARAQQPPPGAKPRCPEQEQEGQEEQGAEDAGGTGETQLGRPAKRHRSAGRATEATAAAAAAATAAAESGLLPPGSLGPQGTPVAATHLPSLEAFWRDHMSTCTPVVISGAMGDWPALQRWADPAYLIVVAGPRTVPVEVGEHYLADQWGQQLMTLQHFVQQHILGAGQDGAPGSHAEAAQQQEQEKQGSAAAAQRAQRAYLAQHPLFDQIPALAADIREPSYCCLGKGEVHSINAWFGPTGTVTPLHTDPHPNLLCQAVGRKYVRLYSPACTAAMYPHAEGMHTNSGRVDVGAPDLRRFPLFGEAPFQDCVLDAGQMLFIPAGWWHYVKSTSISFSVSYWWR